MAALVPDAEGSLDVLIAPATPPGMSALAVVRLSGPPGETLAVARRLVPSLPERPVPWRARTGKVVDENGEVLDLAIVLYFASPRSPTGEEVVELSCHGSPAVVGSILRAGRRAGARLARPGELTRRALGNGKLDLAEAEGIQRLASAVSRGAARRALGLAEGELSRRVAQLRRGTLELLVELEAGLDFTEDVDAVPVARATEAVDALSNELGSLLAATSVERGSRAPVVVILGRPNAGKSTLFNALLGEDRAIVTEIPGTTRDALAEELELSGERVRIVDTAGLRESGDGIERMGVEIARRAAGTADLVLYLVDPEGGLTEEDRDVLASIPSGRTLVVATKKDRGGPSPSGVELFVSARSGEGLPALNERIVASLGLRETEGTLSILERHRAALERAARELRSAREEVGTPEVLAGSLRRTLTALGEITGETATEELLDAIFSTFCIGK